MESYEINEKVACYRASRHTNPKAKKDENNYKGCFYAVPFKADRDIHLVGLEFFGPKKPKECVEAERLAKEREAANQRQRQALERQRAAIERERQPIERQAIERQPMERQAIERQPMERQTIERQATEDKPKESKPRKCEAKECPGHFVDYVVISKIMRTEEKWNAFQRLFGNFWGGPYWKFIDLSPVFTTKITAERGENFKVIFPQPVFIEKNRWTDIKFELVGPSTERLQYGFGSKDVIVEVADVKIQFLAGSRQLPAIYFK